MQNPLADGVRAPALTRLRAGTTREALTVGYRALIRFVELAVGLLLLLLAVIVPVGVFFRYGLNDALSWTDEVGGLLLVCMTFLGCVIALDRGTHLDMDLFSHKFPPLVQTLAHAGADLVLAVWLVVIMINGWTISTQLFDQTLVSLPISRGLFQGVMPVSAALMLIVLAARWFLPGATTRDRNRLKKKAEKDLDRLE